MTAKADLSFGLTWRHPLLPYQEVGIARLVAGSLLLADDMGLGKTVQAIGALRVLDREALPALIVAPASLVLQWRSALRTWAPELRPSTAFGPGDERAQAWRRDADVYLTSYESLRADIYAQPRLRDRAWAVVIADEAQRIKNRRTEAARALKRLRTRRAWALTGTPLENSVDDVVSILDFVAPGRFDRRQMMVGFRRLLAEMQLRRKRTDVLQQLPAKTAFVVDPGLTPLQRAAYDAAEAEGLVWLGSLGDRVSVANVLELLLRLKQICNADPESGESAKMDDLDRRVSAVLAEGLKAIVFSQFVAEPFGVQAIRRRLQRFDPLALVGGQDAAERAFVLGRFADDAERRLMIVSLKAGGAGLNLTQASVVFHVDRWWTAAVERQAEDRVHRLGQTRPVQVFAYSCSATVEERIAAIIATKQQMSDVVIDGEEPDMLRRLTLTELLWAAGLK